MGDFSVRMMTNENHDFYGIMGPFLSRREIVKELGGPVWDDPDKLWFIVADEDTIIGFAAIIMKGEGAHFCSDWVRSEYRERGVHDVLIHARTKYIDEKHLPATAIVTLKAASAFERYDFTREGGRKLKNYVRLERKAR